MFKAGIRWVAGLSLASLALGGLPPVDSDQQGSDPSTSATQPADPTGTPGLDGGNGDNSEPGPQQSPQPDPSHPHTGSDSGSDPSTDTDSTGNATDPTGPTGPTGTGTDPAGPTTGSPDPSTTDTQDPFTDPGQPQVDPHNPGQDPDQPDPDTPDDDNDDDDDSFIGIVQVIDWSITVPEDGDLGLESFPETQVWVVADDEQILLDINFLPYLDTGDEVAVEFSEAGEIIELEIIDEVYTPATDDDADPLPPISGSAPGTTVNNVDIVIMTPHGVAIPSGAQATAEAAFNEAAAYWSAQSGGQFNLRRRSIRTHVAARGINVCATGFDPWEMWTYAGRQAGWSIPAHINPTNRAYTARNHLLVIVPAGCEGSPNAGIGTIGQNVTTGGLTVVFQNTNHVQSTSAKRYTAYADVIAHEIGHNLGLEHASTLSCLAPANTRTASQTNWTAKPSKQDAVLDARFVDASRGGNCIIMEYFDVQDVMGYSGTANMGSLSAPAMARLGWHLPTINHTNAGAQRHTITALQQRGNHPQAVRIRDPLSGMIYWLELRTDRGFDAGYNGRFWNAFWSSSTSVRHQTHATYGVRVLLEDYQTRRTVLLTHATATTGNHNSAQITSNSALTAGRTFSNNSGSVVVTVESISADGNTAVILVDTANQRRADLTGGRVTISGSSARTASNGGNFQGASTGQTLTAHASTFSPNPSRYTYAWFAVCISNPCQGTPGYRASGQTYTIRAGDVGMGITVEVTAHAAGRAPTMVTASSPATGYVVAVQGQASTGTQGTNPTQARITIPNPSQPQQSQPQTPSQPASAVPRPGADLGNIYHIRHTLTSGTADVVFAYGRSTDTVLVGDWNGDGRDSFAVRRGNEFHIRNSLTSGTADYVISFGRPDDIVLVGDWNGDGRDTFAIRRGNQFHIRNSLTSGPADYVISFGRPDDMVYVGNWNGSGGDTFAIRRGNEFHIRNSLTSGPADYVIAFGRPGDVVLVGDWNGNGQDTFAIRRGNMYHIRNTLTSGPADVVIAYGRPTDVVYVGNWNGIGGDSLAVRRRQ